VPVDPAHPTDRLAHTAQDAGLGLVITRLPGFPAVTDCVRVTPDELMDESRSGGPASRSPAPMTPPTSSTPPAPPAGPRASSYRTAT